jgi:hypothetical protein
VTDVLAESLTPLSFTVIDDDTIDLLIPSVDTLPATAGEPMSIFLQICGDSTTGGAPIGFTFDAFALLLISPPETPAGGGELITLQGTSLDATIDLKVDNVSTPFAIVSATSITFDAPASGGGSGAVDVEIKGAIGALSFDVTT